MSRIKSGVNSEAVPESVDENLLPDPKEWLPDLYQEIPGLKYTDPRMKLLKAGEWQDGIDNMDEKKKVVWGGLKQWEGDKKPANYECPEWAQKVFDVPHMPGQPIKEFLARKKVQDPRPFQDKFFFDKARNHQRGWTRMLRDALRVESFGMNSEKEPAEWAGQEPDCVPKAVCAYMHESQTDVCSVLAGKGWYKEKNESEPGKKDGEIPDVPVVEDTEFDYVEYLYAKDQEGKCIYIQRFEHSGKKEVIQKAIHFIPPRGTKQITPFASFKIRGAWVGEPIKWNPHIDNADMEWFTTMTPENRLKLAKYKALEPHNRKEADSVKYPKMRKQEPVLWPENSHEGNMMKARNAIKQGAAAA